MYTGKKQYCVPFETAETLLSNNCPDKVLIRWGKDKDIYDFGDGGWF